MCLKAVKPNSWTLQFSPRGEISHHISGTKTQINKTICSACLNTEYWSNRQSSGLSENHKLDFFWYKKIQKDFLKVFNLLLVCDCLFFLWRRHTLQSPSSAICTLPHTLTLPPPWSVENHQFYWACCRGEGLQRQGWLAAALPVCTWVCLWKDRTGRNEGTAMSIPPKWEKQTFLCEVSFQLFSPPNSFCSMNFPLVRRLCSQTKLFSCKNLFFLCISY